MKNDKITNNTGGDNANTLSQEKGIDQQTNSGANGVENQETGVLDQKTESGGNTIGNDTEKGKTESFTDTIIPTDWTFYETWNKSLEEAEVRPIEARDNIWASELGKSHIDVFLKMKGTKLTNPPNPRSLRKFEAGNMFEWIVGLILKRAGILHSSQERVTYKYDGLCEVTGRIDYIAGGKPDFDKAKAEIDAMDLPEGFYRGFKGIMEHLKVKYPNGLGIKPLEVKSLSAFMYDGLEKTGKSLKIHRLQAYHYIKSLNLPMANIVYICRDDMRMMEIPVYLNSFVEAEYKAEIEKISYYHMKDEMPPLEKPIVWDTDMLKFAKNFNVAYSGYLTMLYGLQNQMEFDEKYAPMSERWNRVLNRAKAKKKMTDKNLSALKEIEDAGFNVEELLAQMPEVVAEEETTTVE